MMQAEHVQHLIDVLLALPGGHRLGTHALEGELEGLAHSQSRQMLVVLTDVDHLSMPVARLLSTVERHRVHVHATTHGAVPPPVGQQLQQSALARPRWAQHQHALAGLEYETHVMQNGGVDLGPAALLKAFAQIERVLDGLAHRGYTFVYRLRLHHVGEVVGDHRHRVKALCILCDIFEEGRGKVLLDSGLGGVIETFNHVIVLNQLGATRVLTCETFVKVLGRIC
mmetsp:Transcript_10461/g.26330  ORF Transcript_10461/g.26330 Transcript_10461/m.26330 type:complete len:226 (-) Transcript_10461:280-957(-)